MSRCHDSGSSGGRPGRGRRRQWRGGVPRPEGSRGGGRSSTDGGPAGTRGGLARSGGPPEGSRGGCTGGGRGCPMGPGGGLGSGGTPPRGPLGRGAGSGGGVGPARHGMGSGSMGWMHALPTPTLLATGGTVGLLLLPLALAEGVWRRGGARRVGQLPHMGFDLDGDIHIHVGRDEPARQLPQLLVPRRRPDESNDRVGTAHIGHEGCLTGWQGTEVLPEDWDICGLISRATQQQPSHAYPAPLRANVA